MAKRTIQIKPNTSPFILAESYAPTASQDLAQELYGRNPTDAVRPINLSNVIPTEYGLSSFFHKINPLSLDIPISVEYAFTYNDSLGNNTILLFTQTGEAYASTDGVSYIQALGVGVMSRTLKGVELVSGIELSLASVSGTGKFILEFADETALYLDSQYTELSLAIIPSTLSNPVLGSLIVDNPMSASYKTPSMDLLVGTLVVSSAPTGITKTITEVSGDTGVWTPSLVGVPLDVEVYSQDALGKYGGAEIQRLPAVSPGSGASGVNFDVTVDFSGLENSAAWAGKLYTGNYPIYPVSWELSVIYNNALYHYNGTPTGRSTLYTPTANMDALLKLLVTYAAEFATGDFAIKNLVSNGLNNISGLRIEPGLVNFPEQGVAPIMIPNVFWFEGTNLYPPAVPTGNYNNTVPKGSLIATIPDSQFGIDITIPALESGKTMFLLEFTYLNINNIWGDYLAFYMNGVNLPCVSDYNSISYSIDENNQAPYDNGRPGDEVVHLLLPIAVINGVDPTAGTNTIRIENRSDSRGNHYVNGLYVYPDPGNLTIRMYNLPATDIVSNGTPQVVNYSLVQHQTLSIANSAVTDVVLVSSPAVPDISLAQIDPVSGLVTNLASVGNFSSGYDYMTYKFPESLVSAGSLQSYYNAKFYIQSETLPSSQISCHFDVTAAVPSINSSTTYDFQAVGTDTPIYAIGSGRLTSLADSLVAQKYKAVPTELLHVNPWSFAVIKNTLFAYYQGLNSILEFKTPENQWVELTPSFLNTSQIRGIFQAKGRLGAWDATNTLYISSSLDPMDFTPSLATRADSLQVDAIVGNIISILPYKDGFIIYCSASIVLATFTGGTYTFNYKLIASDLGVLNTKSVCDAGDIGHFAYTSGGLKLVSSSIVSVSPELDEYLLAAEFSPRLDYIQSRYLVISSSQAQSSLNTFGSVATSGIIKDSANGMITLKHKANQYGVPTNETVNTTQRFLKATVGSDGILYGSPGVKAYRLPIVNAYVRINYTRPDGSTATALYDKQPDLHSFTYRSDYNPNVLPGVSLEYYVLDVIAIPVDLIDYYLLQMHAQISNMTSLALSFVASMSDYKTTVNGGGPRVTVAVPNSRELDLNPGAYISVQFTSSGVQIENQADVRFAPNYNTLAGAPISPRPGSQSLYIRTQFEVTGKQSMPTGLANTLVDTIDNGVLTGSLTSLFDTGLARRTSASAVNSAGLAYKNISIQAHPTFALDKAATQMKDLGVPTLPSVSGLVSNLAAAVDANLSLMVQGSAEKYMTTGVTATTVTAAPVNPLLGGWWITFNLASNATLHVNPQANVPPPGSTQASPLIGWTRSASRFRVNDKLFIPLDTGLIQTRERKTSYHRFATTYLVNAEVLTPEATARRLAILANPNGLPATIASDPAIGKLAVVPIASTGTGSGNQAMADLANILPKGYGIAASNPLTPSGQYQLPSTAWLGDLTTGSNLLRYMESLLGVNFPSVKINAQTGSHEYLRPVYDRGLVLDTKLKSWGSINSLYRIIMDYAPVNDRQYNPLTKNTTSMYSLRNLASTFGIIDTTDSLFSCSESGAGVDSWVDFGFVQFTHSGMTRFLEAKAFLALDTASQLTILGSLDGSHPDLANLAAVSNSGLGIAEVRQVMTGKWFIVRVSGDFQLKGLEFSGEVGGLR